MTSEELCSIDKSCLFHPVSEELKKEIYNECKEVLVGDFMCQSVCAVCDELVRRKDFSMVRITDKVLERCRNRLAPACTLPLSMRLEYDISKPIPALENVLLSK